MKSKIVVFASGEGTNFEAIINACKQNILEAEVVSLFCNRDGAGVMQKSLDYGINPVYVPFFSREEKRESYEEQILKVLNDTDYDLIVLAGWMYVFTKTFLNNIKSPIINLHPSLPGMFPGKSGIEDAFEAFRNNKITKTGVMVHHVVEKMDAGDVIELQEVQINKNDSLEDLQNRVRYYEKPVLIKAIDKTLAMLNTPKRQNKLIPSYVGKVRDVYDVGYNVLAMVQTDRQSAFDRDICQIPGKGRILTLASKWWFQNTTHIVPNHFLHSDNNIMFCKKADTFKIEVVVRGYITGSTSTSLWTHYNKGERTYCGITFPDGLKKNQRLENNVVTPTTKGIVDELISEQQIIEQKYMTEDEWYYIKDKALKLFEYGQMVSEQKGLILVDTKYEFGRSFDNGEIMLIDEIHTCDSSRFWLKDTYQEKFEKGEEPDKFDKDIVRGYIVKNCDPYKDKLPEIPEELIQSTKQAYLNFIGMLTGNSSFFTQVFVDDNYLIGSIKNYFANIHQKMCVVMAGSQSDDVWIKRIKEEVNKLNIYVEVHVASAHKETKKVMELLDRYNTYRERGRERGRKIVFVAVAGMSNALGGVISANSQFPTINCPPFKDTGDMNTNLNSSMQNPRNVPAMTVLHPVNVALAVKRILDL